MTRWLWLSIMLAALAFAATLFLYVNRDAYLPEQVPTHWNGEGVANAFTARDNIVWVMLLLPATMVGTIGLTFVLPWLSPRAFSIETFRGPYNMLMAIIVAMMGYLHLIVLIASTTYFSGQVTMRMLLGGLYVFFGLLGNLLGKVRRNFFVGIRTPWTLASETVWNQTHRVGAWLMVGGAVLAFLTVVVNFPFYIGFGILMVSALAPVVYSLILYKKLERQGKLSSGGSDAGTPAG